MRLRRRPPLTASLAVAIIVLGAAAAIAAPQHNAPSRVTLHVAPPGVVSTSFTAVVKATGGLVRGVGATAAFLAEGPGTYEVDFAADVTHCAYTATIGEPGSNGHEGPGFITVVARAGTANAVYVETYTRGGKLKNFPFHVDVGC